MLSTTHMPGLQAQGRGYGPQTVGQQPCDALSTLRCRNRHQRGAGYRIKPVIPALIIAITAGCSVRWLNHAGLIALRNLDASRLLVTVKAGFGTGGSA